MNSEELWQIRLNTLTWRHHLFWELRGFRFQRWGWEFVGLGFKISAACDSAGTPSGMWLQKTELLNP